MFPLWLGTIGNLLTKDLEIPGLSSSGDLISGRGPAPGLAVVGALLVEGQVDGLPVLAKCPGSRGPSEAQEFPFAVGLKGTGEKNTFWVAILIFRATRETKGFNHFLQV